MQGGRCTAYHWTNSTSLTALTFQCRNLTTNGKSDCRFKATNLQQLLRTYDVTGSRGNNDLWLQAKSGPVRCCVDVDGSNSQQALRLSAWRHAVRCSSCWSTDFIDWIFVTAVCVVLTPVCYKYTHTRLVNASFTCHSCRRERLHLLCGLLTDTLVCYR